MPGGLVSTFSPASLQSIIITTQYTSTVQLSQYKHVNILVAIQFMHRRPFNNITLISFQENLYPEVNDRSL